MTPSVFIWIVNGPRCRHGATWLRALGWSGLWRSEGQADGDRRAASLSTRDGDGAAVLLDDPLRSRQPEPDTEDAPDGVGAAMEALEDVW